MITTAGNSRRAQVEQSLTLVRKMLKLFRENSQGVEPQLHSLELTLVEHEARLSRAYFNREYDTPTDEEILNRAYFNGEYDTPTDEEILQLKTSRQNAYTRNL